MILSFPSKRKLPAKMKNITRISSSYSSLLMFLCIYNHLSTNFVSSQCLDDQKSTLLELKNNLKFDPEALDKLDGWNQSIDCCQWNGVECNISSGHVSGLNLSMKNIIGSINNFSSLFHLQFLQTLNFGYNNIQGTVPLIFFQIPTLRILDFSFNSMLQGSLPIFNESSSLENIFLSWTKFYGVLPNSISKLKRLRTIHLNNCNFHGQIPSFRSLNLLEDVDLSHNQFSGSFPSLTSGKNLKFLNLKDNSLTGSVTPTDWERLLNLKHLDLSNNLLDGNVPSSMASLSVLEYMDLSRNLFSDPIPSFSLAKNLETLFLHENNLVGPITVTDWGELPKLQVLDLSYNALTGSIPSSFGSLDLLEDLYLSNNQFSGVIPTFSSAKNLWVLNIRENNLIGSITATEWGELLNLQWLDLSFNSLNGSIPKSLFSLPSLEIIYLQENNFSGKLNEFASSMVLESLDLSSNKLEGIVPKSIFQLKELVELDFSSNELIGALELADILNKLKNLKRLDLSHNLLTIETHGCTANSSFQQLLSLRLASCKLQIMPEFLKNQTSLLVLDLSMNQISGKIPRWIWGTNARSHSFGISLNLSYNQFVNIESASPLPNASALLWRNIDLHSNNLEGQIPTILNVTQLELLNLKNNHLVGRIPSFLISMSTLRVIDLRNNNLEGDIPSNFEKNCSLETLNLNGNFLGGQIPRSLSNCKALKVLDLGNNLINDTFPCYLKSLANLQVLVLRTNLFHGIMLCPESHSIWPMLQIVDLASNYFTGKLHVEFFLKWIAMKAGKSNGKSRPSHLQSTISTGYYQNQVEVAFKNNIYELQYILTIFTSIDFSNNAFDGELPNELGYLNALIVLNLSHNYLSGNIPSSIGKLNQIESLDLSCNSFSGKIPPQFANLNYLGYLNLSFNKLSGKIPTGTQLQLFDASSFEGNQGLYGPPLTPFRSNTPDSRTTSATTSERWNWSLKSEIKWIAKGAEIGFPVGIIIFIGPLLYIKRWREWYCKQLHSLVMKIMHKEDGRRSSSSRMRWR